MIKLSIKILRVIYICSGLFLLFILSQLPLSAVQLTKHTNFPKLFLYITLNLFSIVGWIIISKIMGVFSTKPEKIQMRFPLQNRQRLGETLSKNPFFLYFLVICLSLFLLYLANVVPSIVAPLLQASHKHLDNSSQNQELILSYLSNSNIFAFFFSFSLAPFFEEVIFRYGIYSLFPKEKYQLLAFALSTIVFATMHMIGSFDNPVLWLTYLLTSAVLCGLYSYFKNIYLNIAVHLIYNSIILLIIIMQ